jgi:hypothetical protein
MTAEKGEAIKEKGSYLNYSIIIYIPEKLF